MSYSNPQPQVYSVSVKRRTYTDEDYEGDERDMIDSQEVYDMIREIKDPEHPLTLEQLKVVSPDLITVDDAKSTIDVMFTPTIDHCSMATLIGLAIRVKLDRSLPRRFKTRVQLTSGSHTTEEEVNRQLNDKERIAAAMENPALLNVINNTLKKDF